MPNLTGNPPVQASRELSGRAVAAIVGGGRGLVPERIVREFVEEEGILLWGTAPVVPLEEEGRRLRAWLDRGSHGGLAYLVDTAADRADPTRPGVLRAGARGVVLLGLPYAREPAPTDPARRPVARYLRGRNYHSVARGVLRRLASRLHRAIPGIALRPFCDARPVMEKALAVRAGLGWQGRNTLVLHPRLGSTFVLCGLLADRPLPARTLIADGCGSCRRCIDACPTGALSLPGVLDAGRCLSRWTTAGLEPPPSLPRGPYARGCDVCQDVCPFNEGPSGEPYRGLYQRTTSDPGSSATAAPSSGGCSSPPPKSV
jgi:epoxyqueuosine reductase